MRLPTLLASLTLLLPVTALAQATAETGQRQFHIATVHLDGVTGIAASPAACCSPRPMPRATGGSAPSSSSPPSS